MILRYKFKSETEHDKCLKLLKISNTVYDWGVTPQQMDILAYYIRFGYSGETMEMIVDDKIVKNKKSLYTQNHSLAKLGLLSGSKTNMNSKKLSSEAILIKDFLKNKTKALLIEVVDER